VNTTLSQLDEISKTRWRDILEEPDDENEDEASALVRTLIETDPKLYRETLQAGLQEAVLKHETSITEAANEMMIGETDISQTVALLRSIRLSMSSLQHAFPDHTKLERFREVVPKLQMVVANEVATQLSK